MRKIKMFFCVFTLSVSFNASAFVITDTYTADRLIPAGTSEGKIFELIPLGYSPATDAITRIKISYDFTEIYSPTNQGDDEDYVDMTDEEAAHFIAEDEPAILNMWLFNYKAYYPDIDTGLIVYERDWTRNDMCQFEAFGIPGDDSTVYCELNLDLYGNLNAYVFSYTNNLWLNAITVEAEVERTTQVPEPNSMLLLGLGLFALGLRYHFSQS